MFVHQETFKLDKTNSRLPTPVHPSRGYDAIYMLIKCIYLFIYAHYVKNKTPFGGLVRVDRWYKIQLDSAKN